MESSDIISIVALCCSVVFALPPFIKMIIDACKDKLYFFLTGADTDNETSIILYIKFINKSENPVSIYDIKVNSSNTLFCLPKDNSSGVNNAYINPYETVTIKITCPNLYYDKPISIKFFTTRRSRAYKKNMPSYINLDLYKKAGG